MSVLLLFLRFAWPYILGAVVVGGAIYAANHWHNAAYRDVAAERDELAAEKKAAQERATALTMLWDTERQAREADARQREEVRNARFVPVESAARNLPVADARVPFPASAARVLGDAIAAGNASLTGSAAATPETAGNPAAAASDVADVTVWGVAVAKLYGACVDQVIGWNKFYANLQAAQLAEAIH